MIAGLTTDELILIALTIFCAVILLLAMMGASRQFPPDEDAE